MQKIFYLPEAPTDFILLVIAEELGVVGVFALLSLYGLIAFAGLRAAKAAPRSLYSALIAVGVTALILSQAIPQHVRGTRFGAADRGSAPVRLLRLEQPHP